MSDKDSMPRPKGCLCTHEEGDSACPVHPTCDECGALLSPDHCCECDEERQDLNGSDEFEVEP